MEKLQLHVGCLSQLYIVLRVHLRVFEAVAVSAMMHTPEGRIDRNSPIRKRDCRNVDPLCM